MRYFRIFGLIILLAIGVSGWFFSSLVQAETSCVSNAVELQAALDRAEANGEADIIRIVQGNYIGNFIYASIQSDSLTMEGGYIAGCDPKQRIIDPDNTVLDAQNNDRVLRLIGLGSSSDFVVDGLTLQNGYGERKKGAGLYVERQSGDFTLSNSIVKSNSII